MRRENGHATPGSGFIDTGGDALGVARELLRRLVSNSAGEHAPAPAPSQADSPAAPSPVRFYVPTMIAARPAPAAPLALANLNVLCLSDESSLAPPSRLLLRVAPGARTGEPLVRIEASEPLALAAALERIDPRSELVVLAIDGSHYASDALLTDRATALAGLLNAFFAIVQRLHTGVAEGAVRVGTLVYNAWDGGILNPLTGLFGGFIKSLRRDFPRSFAVAAVSDAPLDASLAFFASELAQQRASEELPELFLRHGERLHEALAPNDVPSDGGRPLFSAETVVLATGGARGVTALLVEDLLERYGCRVIALGRTTADGLPSDLLAMSEAELHEYEPEYYRRAMSAGQRTSPAEMKRRFSTLVSAHEVALTIRTLEAAGGSFEYLRVDLTDAPAVEAAVADVYRRYGKIDVVMHGAGTQISKRIAKRTVGEFDLVVSSKLTALRHLHAAVARHAKGEPVDYHILTSAFSFWGNDGQPDYGAANETLNRLAAAKTSANGLRGNWSTLAWLAWPSIGMAKGFSWLGSARTLYPLGKAEGQRIFRALTQRAPAQPANILATPSEIGYFNVPITQPKAEPRSLRERFDLSPPAAPFLADHVVNGIQTVPGAVEFFSAASIALRLCPGMRVEALHNCRFKSFLRFYPDRPNAATISARVVRRDPTGATVRVQICSDFIHPSGRVMKEDVEHFAADVSCVPAASLVDAVGFDSVRPRDTDVRIGDPYIGTTLPLQLGGMFDCLRDIRLGPTHQFAALALPQSIRESPLESKLAAVLAIDAMARVGTMLATADAVAICVPVAATSLMFYVDLASEGLFEIFDGACLSGTRPRTADDGSAMLHMDRIWATGKTGVPLMEIRRSVAKVQGSVPIHTLLSTTRS